MEKVHKITPFLWFDRNAEEAADYYCSIFKDSKIGSKSYYSAESAKASGLPEGSVMTVEFWIEGQPFTALNGGPTFRFTEAVSFVIHCKDQKEIDYYWKRLTEGGDPNAQVCGWLKDKYGLSWQVIPKDLPKLLKNPGAMGALMKMKKLEIDKLM